MSASTIFACSSGQGRTGIAVWRVSGPKAADIALAMAGKVPERRRATYLIFKDQEGNRIDDGIVLWFSGPRSVTGEDLVEFHSHGGHAIRVRMTETLAALGAKPASPGEFTMRAFENGRMDLLEVEALGDLLDAETEAQRRQAIAIGEGQASALVQRWKVELIGALAVLEAAVDFPDEDDIPSQIANQAIPKLNAIYADMKDHLGEGQGRKIREGLKLAIVGAPNAGKSSFLNKLLGEDRAIVSDIPGTTRDIVSARIVIRDRLVNVLDTAGLRQETNDPIERQGIERSKDALRSADIVVRIRDSTDGATPVQIDTAADIIEIDNKIDLNGGVSRETALPLSVVTGDGWDRVLEEIGNRVVAQAQPSLFPHERQAALISGAVRVLENTIGSAEAGLPQELLAEDVRTCLDALDQLEGRRTTEAVLGQIFSSFCIGK